MCVCVCVCACVCVALSRRSKVTVSNAEQGHLRSVL